MLYAVSSPRVHLHIPRQHKVCPAFVAQADLDDNAPEEDWCGAHALHAASMEEVNFPVMNAAASLQILQVSSLGKETLIGLLVLSDALPPYTQSS